MSRRSFVFEIISLDDCDGYERKIRSAVGADLVKIDSNRGHVIVSTSKRCEELRLALENKTRRKVVFLYSISLPNPKSIRNMARHANVASTSLRVPTNHVSAEVKSSKMMITLKPKYQGERAVVNAPQGKGAYYASGSTFRIRPKSYHRHGLTFIEGTQSSFRCSGCKEFGIGNRYVCEQCSYILHPDCMYYEKKATHKFLDGSTFDFHQKTFDDKVRFCDACGSDLLGFFYHCKKTSKDLHPCCLKLPETVPVGDVKFRLCRKLTSDCFYCHSKTKDYIKDNCWCYSLERQDCQAHVSCMRAAILECLKGGRNHNMSTMVIVKHDKQITHGLIWAQKLLGVALSVLSGNPFPLLGVAIELLQ